MLISSLCFIPFFHFHPIFMIVSLFLYFLPAFLARKRSDFLRGSNARSRSRHNLLPLRKPSLEQGFSAALAESLARREPAFAVRAAPRCRPRPGDVTGSMAWRGEA